MKICYDLGRNDIEVVIATKCLQNLEQERLDAY